MDDQDIKNAVVEKMLRKRVVGGKKQQVQTVVGYSVPSHAEGRAKDLVADLIREGVLERYGGGHRANVRLTSVEKAVAYLEENGGNVPFPFE